MAGLYLSSPDFFSLPKWEQTKALWWTAGQGGRGWDCWFGDVQYSFCCNESAGPNGVASCWEQAGMNWDYCCNGARGWLAAAAGTWEMRYGNPVQNWPSWSTWPRSGTYVVQPDGIFDVQQSRWARFRAGGRVAVHAQISLELLWDESTYEHIWLEGPGLRVKWNQVSESGDVQTLMGAGRDPDANLACVGDGGEPRCRQAGSRPGASFCRQVLHFRNNHLRDSLLNMAVEEALHGTTAAFSRRHLMRMLNHKLPPVSDLSRFDAQTFHVCPVGVLAIHSIKLLANADRLDEVTADGLVQDVIARIVYGLGFDWNVVMASGWPIFRLAARLLDVIPAKGIPRLKPVCHGIFKTLIENVREREESESFQQRAFSPPVYEASRLGKLMPEFLMKCVEPPPPNDTFMEDPGPSLRDVFESVQGLQRHAYLIGSCPTGSFAWLAKAGYRLCVVAERGGKGDSLVPSSSLAFSQIVWKPLHHQTSP